MRWLSTAALAAVLVLLIAVVTYRVQPIDVPVHLATGRLIWETSTFPTTNTFSWTFPDHRLDQQYPMVQVFAWLLVDHLGFGALSLVCAGGWIAAVLAWMRWAGPPQRWPTEPMLWFLVVVGVSRHAVQRPEIVTVLGLGVLLLAFDAWRRGRTAALIALPLTTWVMVNSHQLFVVGVVLQLGFVVHVWGSRVAGGRFGLAADDGGLPMRPLLLFVAASLGVLMISPLGPGVYLAPMTMLSTLSEHGAAAGGGAQSLELQPVWTDPFATGVVVILTAVCGVQLARTWGRWAILELGVLVMGLAMVAIALRGIPFFALAAGAVASRLASRAEPAWAQDAPVARALAAVAGAFSLGLAVVRLSTPVGYLTPQPGLGRSHGEWADHTLAFLRDAPPPGRVLNVGWVTGNPLIWGELPVFVDPRWEAYPRSFLVQCITAMEDADVFASQIARYQPHWIVGEMRRPDVQARLAELLAGGRWRLVHLDSLLAVLVREGPDTATYLAEHAMDPATADIPDWNRRYPVLLAEQQVRVARFLVLLGEPEAAAPLLQAARAAANDARVSAELATVPRPR